MFNLVGQGKLGHFLDTFSDALLIRKCCVDLIKIDNAGCTVLVTKVKKKVINSS